MTDFIHGIHPLREEVPGKGVRGNSVCQALLLGDAVVPAKLRFK